MTLQFDDTDAMRDAASYSSSASSPVPTRAPKAFRAPAARFAPSRADIQYVAVEDLPERKFGFYRDVLKYGLDATLIVLSAILVFPVIAIMAFLVSRDGHSPFYSQSRIGKNGKVFRLWKMRTMVPNAQAKLDGYLAQNPEARIEWETTQKLKNDPRITRVGRILRKTSLDELPQLWNVLVGDMALVGPRPMMLDQRSMYPGKGYYLVRPGITGLWQISDRNECTFAERAKYDDAYEQEVSLLADTTILLRTVGVVIRGTGY